MKLKERKLPKIITYSLVSLLGIGAISAGIYLNDDKSEASYVKNITANDESCEISSGAKGVVKDVFISDTSLYSLAELSKKEEFKPAIASGVKAYVITNLGEYYYEIPKLESEAEIKSYLNSNKKIDVADMCVIPIKDKEDKVIGTATEGFKFKIVLPSSNLYEFTKYESGQYGYVSNDFTKVNYTNNDVNLLANISSQKSENLPDSLEYGLNFTIQSKTTKVIVNKVDSKGVNLDEGYEFAIVDNSNGRTLGKAVTDSEGKVEFENIPVGVKYTIHETKRPDGKKPSKQTVSIEPTIKVVKSFIEVVHDGKEDSSSDYVESKEDAQELPLITDDSNLTEEEKNALKNDDPSTPDVIEGLETDSPINLPGETYSPNVDEKEVWNGYTQGDLDALKDPETAYCYMEYQRDDVGCEREATDEEIELLKEQEENDKYFEELYQKERKEQEEWENDRTEFIDDIADKYEKEFNEQIKDTSVHSDDDYENTETTLPEGQTISIPKESQKLLEEDTEEDEVPIVNDNEEEDISPELPQTGYENTNFTFIGLSILLGSAILILSLNSRKRKRA